MIREKKTAQVQDLTETFRWNSTFYLLDYIHIPVSKSMALRRKLRENSCSLKVIKNRLALKSLLDTFPEDLKSYFRGPTAISFTDEDPLALAKVLKDFMIQNKILLLIKMLFVFHLVNQNFVEKMMVVAINVLFSIAELINFVMKMQLVIQCQKI